MYSMFTELLSVDITGDAASPARVRFLNALSTEDVVLEGGDGWVNTTGRVRAADYITHGGASLDAHERRLSALDSDSNDRAAYEAMVERARGLIRRPACLTRSACSLSMNAPAMMPVGSAMMPTPMIARTPATILPRTVTG